MKYRAWKYVGLGAALVLALSAAGASSPAIALEGAQLQFQTTTDETTEVPSSPKAGTTDTDTPSASENPTTPTTQAGATFSPLAQNRTNGTFKLGDDQTGSSKLFVLRSGNLAVDVPGGSTESGQALQGWTANGMSPQAFWLQYHEDTGAYTITNMNSKKSLEVRDGVSAAGAVVQQADTNPGSAAQQWRIESLDGSTYQVVSVLSGLPLGFASAEAGSALVTTDQASGASFSVESYSPSIDEGTYTFQSAVGNSQVLEVADASWNSDQTGLIQSFRDNSSFCQKWYVRTISPGVVTIQNVGSGEYLADTGNGDIVQSWVGGSLREWRLGYSSGGYTFTNMASGNTLGLVDAGGASGTKVRGSVADGSTQQGWNLSGTMLVTGGTYEISPVGDANMRLDVENSAHTNANVQLWYANGGTAQRWTFHGAGDGWWTITSGCAYKGLDVADGSSADGTNVRQWSTNRGPAQLWRPQMGPYGLQLVSYTGKVLDAAGGSTSAGTNVQIWSSNGGMAQAWRLSSTDPTGTTTHWLGINTVGQPNNYYCGPTSGYMILSNLGAWSSVSGTPLTIRNVASYMDTDAYGYTSFNDRKFQQGMNNWLGTSQYYTVHTPSTEQLRSAVLHSFDTGYATAVDEQERRGGPHMNGHSNSTFSHIMVVDGYDEASDAMSIADPGISLWYGASDHFWYNLPAFRDNFLANDLNDGKEHIGFYAYQ